MSIFILTEGAREFAREFVDRELTKAQQDQIKALLRRAANYGLLPNVDHYRRLQGHANLARFKRLGVRLMCFFDGPGRIVITHGFKKKQDRTPREQIDHALRMREAYFHAKRP